MHITLFYCCSRLPVQGYGGTERVVVNLVRGLAELGHRVTLIAPHGSHAPPASVVPIHSRRFDLNTFDVTPYVPAGTDILHSFSRFRIPPRVPYLWTLEGNLREGQVGPPNTIYVSANHAQRYRSRAFVYNGVDPSELTFRPDKADYDLFLGRLHGAKGYHWAIEGAKRAGRRLVVAGGWRPSVSRWVRFVGAVSGGTKAEWLAGARLLWMPALWDEPFGLTIVEALMSGTPVLGTRRGALPELITPDVGATVETLEDMVHAAPMVERADPGCCRARAMRYFSHQAMAEEYQRFYRHYLATGALPEGRIAGETGAGSWEA